MTPFDPSSWLGSPQGREAIERGARASYAHSCQGYRVPEWDSAPVLNVEHHRAKAEAVLASALRGVSCDTCGGSGETLEVEHGQEYRMRCSDCTRGFRPGVLVPREAAE